jgi:hypothetical protein
MYCSQCGSNNADNAQFCSNCGCKLIHNAQPKQSENASNNVKQSKKNGFTNVTLFFSIIGAFFPIGAILQFFVKSDLIAILAVISVLFLVPAAFLSITAFTISLIKHKTAHEYGADFKKRVAALCLSVLLPVVALGVTFAVRNNSSYQTVEKTPIAMTVGYIGDEDNIYGMMLCDWDVEVYLHYSDGTKEKTENFEIVNEDRDFTPANAAKTFTLKSTEFDLTATLDIAIPEYQHFPETREEFCEKLCSMMDSTREIDRYTADYRRNENGHITSVTFWKTLNGYRSEWFFLEFSTFPNDPDAEHFDRVKLEANGGVYSKAEFRDKIKNEMEVMKLLIISLTIPTDSYLETDAYELIQLQGDEGRLTAGNVEYLAFLNEKSEIVAGAMYYMSADIVQAPCYEVNAANEPTDGTKLAETPPPADD